MMQGVFMKKIIWISLGLAGALVSPSFASGPAFSSYGRADKCFDRGLSPDETIAVCQNAILGGLMSRNGATAAYQNMGAAYIRKHDYAEALKAFDYAIKWTPSLWQAYANRGYVYSQLDQLDNALADFGKAIELKPDEPVIYLRRALAYERAQRAADAMADFDKALQINPNYEPALRDRGELKIQMGDTAGGNADISAADAAGKTAKN
jgi:tetratricopeptide (TPR) repeat protein